MPFLVGCPFLGAMLNFQGVGGGFCCFLLMFWFIFTHGEMIHFDYTIFFRWVGSTTNYISFHSRNIWTKNPPKDLRDSTEVETPFFVAWAKPSGGRRIVGLGTCLVERTLPWSPWSRVCSPWGNQKDHEDTGFKRWGDSPWWWIFMYIYIGLMLKIYIDINEIIYNYDEKYV